MCLLFAYIIPFFNKMAGGTGIEPILTQSKCVVLPLDDPPIMVGEDGFEPPMSEDGGFTVRCNKPLCDSPLNGRNGET